MPKSKSKKRKATHPPPYNSHRNKNSNGNNHANLTHEEVWDDSALLRSWDEAVAEYEFYHSIHARGEDVDEVLKQYQIDNGVEEDSNGEEEGEISDGSDAEMGEVIEDADVANTDDLTDSHIDATSSAHGTSSKPPTAQNEGTGPTQATSEPPITTQHDGLPAGTAEGLSPQKQPVTNTSDSTLENLKMAYYWAGYYSGLYDSQRQAQSQVATHSHSTEETSVQTSITKDANASDVGEGVLNG